MTLAQAVPNSALDYDPETGEFRWRASGKGRVIGVAAGATGGNGYRQITIGGVKYQAHRLAVRYMTGEWPTGDVDHINGRRDDNRWANLRCSSRSENMQNQCPLQARNTSGHRGVSRGYKGKWVASIGVDGKKTHLGSFDSMDAAVMARRAAESELHPARVREFA